MKLYDSINKTLAAQGRNTTSTDMYNFVANWAQWYRGNVSRFHYYYQTLTNGKRRKVERLTLNMAKKVCEDMTRLIWSEKTRIELSNQEQTVKLWEILDSKQNNLSVNLPRFIEKTMALGTGMIVEIKQGDDVLLDFIDADLIIPMAYSNSYISEVATISRSTGLVGEKKVYNSLLTIHQFDGKTYTKEHQLYRSTDVNTLGENISLDTLYPDLEEVVKYETDTPHFQIYRPNIVNNLDLDSPMGISIFANRIDNLKAIDLKYDCFYNEFQMGRKRILVDRTAVKSAVDTATGENIQFFDTDDATFMAINGMENQPVKDIDFALRTQEHIAAINTELNYLSAGVGLGQDFYNFDGSNAAKTATEVISENSDTFRSKVNHEIILRDVIYDMVKSICELAGIKSNSISITFDDSVIEDKGAAARQALIEYNAGLIDKVEYFVRAHGMEKDQATQYVSEIEDRNQEVVEEEPDAE